MSRIAISTLIRARSITSSARVRWGPSLRFLIGTSIPKGFKFRTEGAGKALPRHGEAPRRSGGRGASDDASFEEATERAVIANDDVVQDADADQAAGLDQAVRDLDVLGRRGGVAAGVVGRG